MPPSTHVQFAVITVDRHSRPLGTSHPYLPNVPEYLRSTRNEGDYRVIEYMAKNAFILGTCIIRLCDKSECNKVLGHYFARYGYDAVEFEIEDEASTTPTSNFEFSEIGKMDINLVSVMMASVQAQYIEDVAASVEEGYRGLMLPGLPAKDKAGIVMELLVIGRFSWIDGRLWKTTAAPFTNPAMIYAIKSCFAFVDTEKRISAICSRLLVLTATGLYHGLIKWITGVFREVSRHDDLERHIGKSRYTKRTVHTVTICLSENSSLQVCARLLGASLP